MYGGVLRVLFDIPFYWTIVRDDDRAGDASVYRRYEAWQLESEPNTVNPEWLANWVQSTPSVLEVLVGIAERWSQFFEKPVPYYFNHLYRNMGFHMYRGAHLRPSEEEAVRWTVDNWLNRRIEYNGEGSPFPIRANRGTIDMRLIPIWEQMNAYSRQHFM
jgi:hypothetical protein